MPAATPKKPQDHKRPAAELAAEKKLRFSEVEGHELLLPFSEVKGSDQVRLVARLTALGLVGDGEEDEEVSVDDLDMEKLADLIDYVSEKFALDSEAFDNFTKGAGGFERAMNLAVSYAGELGNDGA